MRLFLGAIRSYFFIFTLIGLGISPLHAAQFQVTETADEYNQDGDCSLREAIIAANENIFIDKCGKGDLGEDTIILPVGFYKLDPVIRDDGQNIEGDLDIKENLRIEGPSQGSLPEISGSNEVRVFHILSGVKVDLERLHIRDGHNKPTGHGGGILNEGSLTLSDSILSHNKSVDRGGAIYSSGPLAVLNSTLEKNEASSQGGAIAQEPLESVSFNLYGSRIQENKAGSIAGGVYIAPYHKHKALTAIIQNSMIGPNNQAAFSGGGMFLNGEFASISLNNNTIFDNRSHQHGGGIFNNAHSLTLYNTTVSGNKAKENGGGFHNNGKIWFYNVTVTDNEAGIKGGGGAFFGPGTLIEAIFLNNTLIAGNRVLQGEGPDCYNASEPRMVTNNYNLIGNTSGCILPDESKDQAGTGGAPLVSGLEILADNGGGQDTAGGVMLTHALTEQSLAVDGGDPEGCKDASGAIIPKDQRGHDRPQGSTCDLGAVEFDSKTTGAGSPTDPNGSNPGTDSDFASGGCQMGTGATPSAGAVFLGMLILLLVRFRQSRQVHIVG